MGEVLEFTVGLSRPTLRRQDGMNSAKKGANPTHERWLKMQAVQIVAQLPDDPQDAMRILDLAKELVEDFLSRLT